MVFTLDVSNQSDRIRAVTSDDLVSSVDEIKPVLPPLSKSRKKMEHEETVPVHEGTPEDGEGVEEQKEGATEPKDGVQANGKQPQEGAPQEAPRYRALCPRR